MAGWAMECVVFSSGGDWKIEDSNFIRFGVFECCNFAALNVWTQIASGTNTRQNGLELVK